jgi:ferredoxin
MVAEIGRDAATRGLPISGIGGIGSWRDAAEYLALGCGNVQVCTAAMVYGFKIVQDMIDGLSNYMDEKGYATIEAFRGMALPTVTDWQHLNLAYTEKAVIDQSLCIQCGRCHIACEDTSHQAITASKDGKRHQGRRVRGLQPVRQRLPGAAVHHDAPAAAGRDGHAHAPAGAGRPSAVDAASEQPRGPRLSGRCTVAPFAL